MCSFDELRLWHHGDVMSAEILRFEKTRFALRDLLSVLGNGCLDLGVLPQSAGAKVNIPLYALGKKPACGASGTRVFHVC